MRSVVTVAVNYYAPAPPFEDEGRFARVARYAWGRDYHDIVLPRLRSLADALTHTFGGKKGRAACDHSPFLERAAAERAGLGFVGKNTCLLLPRKGSWFFLGEVLLDVELPSTEPAQQDHCGTCVECLVRCPTDAFVEPFVLDANRCISYLTIEHRSEIPTAIRKRMGAWIFGCDDCQDVCPFNRFAEPSPWPDLHADQGVGPRLDVVDVLSIRDDVRFGRRYGATPLARPKRRGLLRNAAIVARNIGAFSAVPVLEQCVQADAEPWVRGHALWALFGLDPVRARRLADAARRDSSAFVRTEAEAGLAEQAPL